MGWLRPRRDCAPNSTSTVDDNGGNWFLRSSKVMSGFPGLRVCHALQADEGPPGRRPAEVNFDRPLPRRVLVAHGANVDLHEGAVRQWKRAWCGKRRRFALRLAKRRCPVSAVVEERPRGTILSCWTCESSGDCR